MTTKLKNLSKGYGYVDESDVIHKIDPKFLSNAIKLEIPADKVASLLEQLEDEGFGEEVLSSVILDGETKTIDAKVCEVIKMFAEANAIAFNFKDADGVGAAFAQCAYKIKDAEGTAFDAYFACDEMAYKLNLNLDETANTLTVGILEKTSEESVKISILNDDMTFFAGRYFTADQIITKLMIDGTETALTSTVFAELVNKAKNGLLTVLVGADTVKPVVNDDEIKFDFAMARSRFNLVHCNIYDSGTGEFHAKMNLDFGEAVEFQLADDDAEYFKDHDFIGEKEITSIYEYILVEGETSITSGLLNAMDLALKNQSLSFRIDGTAGIGAVTHYGYELEDGTYVDATIEFPGIDRAMDIMIDWDDKDSITIKMRKLSVQADYIYYATGAAGEAAKYYETYADATAGTNAVTPDWATIRDAILNKNANAKIKLLITEKDTTGANFTVVRTYDCVGVRPTEGLLEFRCIEFLGVNEYA